MRFRTERTAALPLLNTWRPGNVMYKTLLKRTPFIGFTADIKSTQALYKQYDGDDKPPKYLLTHKLSQGHLQVFFSAVRGAGGFNNNPTVRQLVATYKRLMMRHDPNTQKVQKNAYLLGHKHTIYKRLG